MQSLTVPGTLEALAPIRSYIRAAAVVAGLDPKRTYGLTLAADEIATNIITHGYAEAGLSGEITVTARVADGRLVVTLRDHAAPYDPLAQATPDDLDVPLDERAIGGLGVFLAKQNVDAMRYHFHDGQHHTTFIMQLDPGHRQTDEES